MFCRSSLLPYSDRHVNLQHECPAVDKVVANVCIKGEKSPDLKASKDKRSKRSSLSRFVKFLSCSGKSKKTRKSASKCDFLQPYMASDGEHHRDGNVNPPLLERVCSTISRRRSGNDVVFGRASSSVADIDIIAQLYDTDISDAGDCVSPSKHRRLSLPVGFTPELCENKLGDRRQHSFISNTPGSVSQKEEIGRSGYCRRAQSRRMTPARKLDAMLLTLGAPSTPKKAKPSPMHLRNYVVEPWSKHLQNQAVYSSSKHLQNQAVYSSSKHLQNQAVYSSSKHLYNQAVDSCNGRQKQLTMSSKKSSKKCVDSLNLSDKQMSQSRQNLSKIPDPSNECPRQRVNSANDCSRQTVNSANDCSKQRVNSANDCPKETVNSAKPVGEDRNMTDRKVMAAGGLQNIGLVSQSQDHVARKGRVASWAVHFDRLLEDPLGVNIFTKFLEKEFSDENMRFWQVCQRFRGLADQRQQQALANDIYSRHIAARASDPVNVDSATRSHTEQLLDSPTSSMFDLAQNQIQRLMKLDSYPRFLKSDLYKNVLAEELEGKIHPEPEQTQEIIKDKKLSLGKENGGKRRRSLLPWMRFL